MRILITNDDGINAKGIRLLAEWAKTKGETVVIGPKVEQSAKSHAIEIVKPFEIKRVELVDGVEAYSLDSTPADCVRFGVLGLKKPFDIVFSGINRGVNVGADIVYSGTVAATFEAARLGLPAVAFSTFPDAQEQAAAYFDQVWEYITKHQLLQENPVYNVNIPAVSKGIRMTYQGSQYFSDEFVKADGENMYVQSGAPVPDVCPDDLNRDTVAVESGYISITPLLCTRTNMDVFKKYQTK